MQKNNENVPSKFTSGLIMSLFFYSQYIDQGQNPDFMALAKQLYNENYNKGTMTPQDIINYSLVQYHLGYAMSPSQSLLLDIFYSPENTLANGQAEFLVEPASSSVFKGDDGLTTGSYSGDIVTNGALAGILYSERGQISKDLKTGTK
jgi:hypothetical protein